MKTPRRTTGSILSEALILLVFAGVVGTAVHLVRPDPKRKIAFVGKHTDCFTIRKKQDDGRKKQDDGRKKQDDGRKNNVETPSGSPPAASLVKALSPQPTETSAAKTVETPTAPTPPIVPPTPPEPPKIAHPPVEGVREIDFDETLRLHKDDAPFLDARRSRFYDMGHIPNARPFSVWEADLDQKIDALTKELPLEMTLVIYCSSGDCEDSHNLATKLKLAGYKDLVIFQGGFPEWLKRKLPIEKTPGAPDAGPADDEAASKEAKK